MSANLPGKRLKLLHVIIGGAALLILAFFIWLTHTSKPKKTPYTIGVIINETELPSGGMYNLKGIVAQKLRQLNDNGGIDGHHLEVIYMDDQNNDEKLL